MEGDEAVGAAPAVGGAEGAFGAVVGVGGVFRQFATDGCVVVAGCVFEAVEQGCGEAFAHVDARGDVAAKDDIINLSCQLVAGDVIADGRQKQGGELIGRNRDGVGGDGKGTDVVGGNVVGGGVIVAQLDGIGGLSIYYDERVERAAAGIEESRNQREQTNADPTQLPPIFTQMFHGPVPTRKHT